LYLSDALSAVLAWIRAEEEAALDRIFDPHSGRQVEMANVRTTLRQRFFGPLR
jgi:hypothetical protein